MSKIIKFNFKEHFDSEAAANRRAMEFLKNMRDFGKIMSEDAKKLMDDDVGKR